MRQLATALRYVPRAAASLDTRQCSSSDDGVQDVASKPAAALLIAGVDEVVRAVFTEGLDARSVGTLVEATRHVLESACSALQAQGADTADSSLLHRVLPHMLLSLRAVLRARNDSPHRILLASLVEPLQALIAALERCSADGNVSKGSPLLLPRTTRSPLTPCCASMKQADENALTCLVLESPHPYPRSSSHRQLVRFPDDVWAIAVDFDPRSW